MDLVMQAAWSVLAVAAAALLVRQRAPRGLWWLVAAACIVVAIDKAVDLQTRVFEGGKVALGAVLDGLGIGAARRAAKALALAVVTVGAIASLVWFVRRDRAIDRSKLLAVAGLALVLALVGVRILPGMAWLADPRAGWAVEAVACALVACGLRGGFRRCDRTD